MFDKAAAKCPLCGKAANLDFTPFCGQGCKDRDLLQWLGEGYRIPGVRAEYTGGLNDGEVD